MTDRDPLWAPGPIPAPGMLLDWHDSRHSIGRHGRTCVLCPQPTVLRSHHGEHVHKTCAERWISEHPVEARLGRFASDIPRKRGDDDHA
ncbi:hypothetical protein [Streptomyces sp. NPDC017941]|uniref:hypothetical protein n=1 Tax=unclassified Streptomyces TaxID=2593676 RepID=UPI0037A53876